ncbi:MAG: arginase family protein, partial [Longimicrobiales bacterium]
MSGRRIAIVGAPSSIGIRPYDDSHEPRRLDLAPGVLRELGLASRLAAEDLGDVEPPPYHDRVRPGHGIRNEDGVAAYSRALAGQVADAIDGGRLALVLGGDCSIVLGSLLGARRHAGAVGLIYIDGHADFATPAESATGSAASMCLALALGRGDSP